MRFQLSAFSFQGGRKIFSRARSLRGMTLIEVVIAVSIMVIIFLGFFGAYVASADLVRSTSARSGALFLMANRMEYVRGLAYASVGTVGGTPSGSLVASESRILNGITYTIRTTVAYIDDGANGVGADYKSVKVEADWDFKNVSQSISTVTYVAP